MQLFGKSFTLLDCTFRDGGYCNNWMFEKSVVNRTLSIFEQLPIDIIEIGFRKFIDDSGAGPYRYTDDKHIQELYIPKNKKLALMVRGRDVADLPNSEVKKLIKPAHEMPIDVIRVSSSIDIIERANELVSIFSDMGYFTSFNLTNVGTHTDSALGDAIKKLKGTKAKLVCLADSYGNMTPDETTRKFNILREHIDTNYGFHAHNNRGLVYANIFAALEAGVNYLDASILGMGRSAGNLRLEMLLLDSMLGEHHRLLPLMQLIEDAFTPLKNKLSWGYDPYYHYGAINKCHPMKMQRFIENMGEDFAKLHEACQTGELN